MNDRDFLGNQINIGDKVIFEAPRYRDFVIGTVISKAEKTCQIEYINDWNYASKKLVVRQFYGQIIKYAALQEREERSKGCAYCYTDAKHNPFVSGYNFCHNCGRPLENNFEE